MDIENHRYPELKYTLRMRHYSSSVKTIPTPAGVLLLVQSTFDKVWVIDAATGEVIFDDLIFDGPHNATLQENLLYAVNAYGLAIIDIVNPEKPCIVGWRKLDDYYSTVSIYGNRIYLMSQSGIRIFDLLRSDR